MVSPESDGAARSFADTSKRELGPRRGRRSQLNFQLAEYHGMIGEGPAVLRGRRSS